MSSPICRQIFHVRHSSKDSVLLLGNLGAAIRKMKSLGDEISVIRMDSNPTVDQDGAFVVVTIDALLDWEVLRASSLKEHGLTCRRYA
ncbi:hypothetical protein SAMN05428989_1948 [Pseudoxanthomonas sp. GM95]|nr:hypothetical protein SAMN05428989_1948 [Pseudoxanthomonas sp. GM95]